jgi:hypothetical protein
MTIRELSTLLNRLVDQYPDQADKPALVWFPDIGFGNNSVSEIRTHEIGTIEDDVRLYAMQQDGRDIPEYGITLRLNAGC